LTGDRRSFVERKIPPAASPTVGVGANWGAAAAKFSEEETRDLAAFLRSL
jgi:hypothetical protein